jgi:predicted phage terminase large subunit-like protein
VKPQPLILAPPEKIRLLAELRERKRQLDAKQRRQWATPGELAKAVDPSTVQTPALDLIDSALAEAFATPDDRLIISIGPQEGKTTRVCRVGSLWALARNQQLKVCVVSYAVSLARVSGRMVRNWCQTFDGRQGSADLGLRIAPDFGAASDWELDGHRGGMLCAGLSTGISGRPVDLLIMDDMFAGREQADSAVHRQKVWDWWTDTGAPRLGPGATVVHVGTRWHENDLAGRLLAADDASRWRVINIPALADHDPAKGQSDPLGREPGEWLQSARKRTAGQWEQIRIQAGTRSFTSLYQGRPSPDQGNVWQRHWWRRYREPLWSQHPDTPGGYLIRSVDEVFTSWDMAFKDTKSSDFVVGQVWARRGADAFLIDQVHKRLSFTDTLVAFSAVAAKYPQAVKHLVEDKANGTAVISTLKSKIPGIVAVNPTDSKYGRATAVAPVIEAGNVLLPDPAIALFDTEAFIDECAQFPNGTHDDRVDTTSQALAEMFLDGTGAQAWLAWAKRKAEQAAAGQLQETSAAPGITPASEPEAAQSGGAPQRPAVTDGPEPGTWLVRSSDGQRDYTVTADGRCDCQAGTHGKRCRHVAEAHATVDPAVLLRLARDAAFRAMR